MRQSDLYRIRHSAAHVMAQAVMEMFPEAKYTIGPPIEDGFYYDFDLPRSLTPEDLAGDRKAHAPDHRRQTMPSSARWSPPTKRARSSRTSPTSWS